jgi:hypothetical protein
VAEPLPERAERRVPARAAPPVVLPA